MATTNPITGDSISSRHSKLYESNYGTIDFSVKLENEKPKPDDEDSKEPASTP